MLNEPISSSQTRSPIPKLLISVLAILVVVAIANFKLIANMRGPEFLVFYGAVITITLLISGWLVQDPTKNLPLPLIPSEPDPYEIAYLRSEERGVANVAVMDLIQHGYLQAGEQSISKTANNLDISQLTAIQHEVFDWVGAWRTATEMLLVGSLTQCLQPHCTVYQQHLQNERLVNSDDEKVRRRLIAFIGMLMIVGLGGFKLVVALVKGRYNVGLLILMCFGALYLLWTICKTPPRLTNRGKKYLKQLQETFAQLKQKVKTEFSSEVECRLIVAIFGVSALTGTPYDYYPNLVLPVIINNRWISSSSGGCSSGSSCSGGSSSSCSGGSSCGGGCGGGCGGCGGG